MKSKQIKMLTLDAMLVAITCVCAVIAIPLSFTPVPITLATFAVLLTGALLSPTNAFLVQIVYLLLGVVGVPVFSGFSSGIGSLLGPTGGYLMVYPLMAVAVSLCKTKINFSKDKFNLVGMIIGIVLATLICYVGGTAWLANYLNKSFLDGLLIGVTPYIIPDVAKIVLAVLVALPVNKALEKLSK